MGVVVAALTALRDSADMLAKKRVKKVGKFVTEGSCRGNDMSEEGGGRESWRERGVRRD